MRMVPIRQVFQKMARLVRDLSKQSGKNIELVLQGEETELDRKVVEDINDPLMHMVRNSVDHGIESPRAARRRRQAGAGDAAPERLARGRQHRHRDRRRRRRASTPTGSWRRRSRSGLVAAGAQLAPADIHQLIFQPGFSTAEKVTEISGRGVGMDVVRRNIEALRGRIDIHTARGAGHDVLDPAAADAGHRRRHPRRGRARALRHPGLRGARVAAAEGRADPQRLRPAVHGAGARSADPEPPPRRPLRRSPGAQREITSATVVVLEDNGRPTALIVDELIGKQEVVIKSLGSTFEGVRGVAGGAILGDGRVGLILDAGGLAGLMGKGAAHHAA